MKKIILVLAIMLMVIPLVYGMRTCDSIQEANTVCEVITPVIDCATYDLYNSTLDLTIDDGTMSQIGSTGMYNFTFNQPDEGTHKILLCDNTTATIEVADYSMKVIYDNDLSNASSIITRGNSAWITATGFATSTQANSILTGIQSNTSYLEGNISSLPVAVWASTTRTLSSIAWPIYTSWSILQNFVWNATGITNITTPMDSHFNALANVTTSEIDSQLNASHGTGNWSDKGGTTTISSSDKDDIANRTAYRVHMNATAIFYNNSLGYPTYETWSYPEWIVNKTYGYAPDDITIINQTNTRIP